MNLTNKKILLLYALSPFLVGVFFGISSLNFLSSLIMHVNIPFGYLIDSLQRISMISGVCYAYGTSIFLLFIVVPSRIIQKLTVKENLITRVIKIVVIVITLIVMRVVFGKNLLDFERLSFDVLLYALFFYLIPKKITGISKKQSHLDQLIHIILSGIMGSALCFLWKNLLLISMDKSMLMNLDLPYGIGFMAVIIFCIPAVLVGIVKIKNIRVSPLNQTATCGVVGFILSCIFGVILGPLMTFLGIAGGIMGMLVTILINLINTPPVKQQEINSVS